MKFMVTFTGKPAHFKERHQNFSRREPLHPAE